MKNGIIYTLITLALVWIAFQVGQIRGRNAQIEPIIGRVDTLYIRDTIRPKPKVITKRVVDSIPYPVPKPYAVHDTIFLPRTQIHEGNEDFSAWISGYEPRLDSILIFPKEKIITKPIAVPTVKRWGIGVQAGIGIVGSKDGVQAQPYIGVGVSYSLFSW